MARYRVLTWRGIPAQVKVRDDAGRRVSRPLPDRFQQEIDRVAMQDGAVEGDAYLAEWTWCDEQEREGSAEEVAAQVVDELVADWDRQRT
jgi:hypothetical protein